MAVIDSSPESTVLVLAVVLFWNAAGTNSTEDKDSLLPLAVWGTKSIPKGDRLVVVVVVELPPSHADAVSDPVTESFSVLESFIKDATNAGAVAGSAGAAGLLLLLMLWILLATLS